MEKINVNKLAKDIADKAYDEFDELVKTSISDDKKAGIEKQDHGVTRKTFENIVKWSINGADYKTIASNLELSNREFELLCKISPSLIWAMQKGQTLAELQLVGSAYECAVGGKTYRKQVLASRIEYDDNGKIVSKTQYPVWIEYEKEPDPYLLKYFMENKLTDNFGKYKNDNDKNRYDEMIKNLSEEERAKLAEQVRAAIIVDVEGKSK